MLNHLVCGNFPRDEEDEAGLKSPDSSPRKSKRNRSHGKGSKKENPYSSRGLDKFSALMADLNEKRQKIYSQMSPQDISLVRFVYSDTDDFVPVVVKAKSKDQRKHKSEELRVRRLPSIESSSHVEEHSRNQSNLESDQKKPEKEKRLFSWNTWTSPSHYVPVVIILILVFLTVFGRSAATLCTCITWYLVPTLKDASKRRKSMKKKDYVRGQSEKKMVLETPRKRGHQKSW